MEAKKADGVLETFDDGSIVELKRFEVNNGTVDDDDGDDDGTVDSDTFNDDNAVGKCDGA